MATVAELLVRIGADTADLRKELNATKRQIKSAFGTDFMSASNTAVKALAGIGVALGAVSVKALQEGAAFKQTEVAFTNLLGSAQKAGDYIKELQDFAKRTPFTFEELTVAAQRFMAMGFKAQEVIPTLRAVGDAAAGVGLGAEGINRISLALGQMKAKGTVQAEEFRQLAEAGIPAWDMLAKKLNTDVATAMKMVERRSVDANTGIAALVEGMNAKYGGMMEQQAKTIAGSFAIMSDGIQQSLAQIGIKIDETFNLSDTMRNVGMTLSDFAQTVKNQGIREALANLIPPELGAALVALGVAMTSIAIPALVSMGATAVAVVQSFVVGLGVFAPWIAALAAVAAAAYYLWEQGVTLTGVLDAMGVSSELVDKATSQLSIAWSNLGVAAKNIYTTAEPLIDLFGVALKFGFLTILNVVGLVIGTFLQLATLAAQAFNAIADAGNWMFDKLKSIFNWLVTVLSDSEGAVGQWTSGIVNKIASMATTVIGYLDKIIGKMTQIANVEISADWMSSGDSDDWDRMSEGFNIYSGQIEKSTAPASDEAKPIGTGGGKTATGKISTEEKQIDALIKKYADASEQARQRGRVALEVAGLNTTLLNGEAKKQGELNDKLAGFALNHEKVIEGYQKELEIANQIEDASARDKTIAEIKAQIDAQNELYTAQQRNAKYLFEMDKLSDISKKQVDKILGDKTSWEQECEQRKEQLNKFLTEVSEMIALASTGEDVNVQQTMSRESQDFMKKALNMTPDELQSELETKAQMIDQYYNSLAESATKYTQAQQENATYTQQWAQLGQTYLKKLREGFGDVIEDWVNGTKSIKEGLQDLAKSIIAQAANMLTQWLLLFAWFSMSGDPAQAAHSANKALFGDPKKKAAGGYITGPGTSTSDEIPTMLSNGEYVVRAAAVDKLGLSTLNAINRGILPVASRYADGGLVIRRDTTLSSAGLSINPAVYGDMKGEQEASTSTAPKSITLNISALDASDFMGFMQSKGMTVLRQLLVDDSRNWATTAKTW